MASCTARVSRTGFAVTPARSEPPAPAMKSTVASDGLAVLGDERDGRQERGGELAARGDEVVVEDVEGVLLAGGRDHEQGQAGAGAALAGLEGGEDLERVGEAGAAPAGAGLGDAEVAAGGRAVAPDADAGRLPAEHLAGLVLGDDAGDVVVDDDDLVDEAAPLAANMPMVAEPQPTRMRCSVTPSTIGGRPAWATSVAPPSTASSTGSRLQSARRAAQVARPSAFEPPVRCSTPPSESIWRAVLGGGDVADRLAAGADDGALGAEVAVGVDLHLGAAVAEDRLGDDGDDVGAVDLAGDDERGGLVVGVGGAGADAGDEAAGGGRSRRPSRRRRTARPRRRRRAVRSRTVSGSERTMRPPTLP